MAGIVGVPNPDPPLLLEDAGGGGRSDADGVERSGRHLELLLGLDADHDIHGLVAVVEREGVGIADGELLSRNIEDAGNDVGDTPGDVVLDVLDLAILEVGLVEDALVARVIEVDQGLALVEALLGVFVDRLRTEVAAIEDGLKAVVDGIEGGDKAGGFGGAGDALHVGASVLEEKAGGAGVPEAPFGLVNERKSIGKLVIRWRRMNGRGVGDLGEIGLLGESWDQQQK